MKRCLKCDKVIDHDFDSALCLRDYAIASLYLDTMLDIDDLPDGLPIEDFVMENGRLDFDGISSW